MRILIVGAGKLGFEIAQLLSQEAHDVVVIDRDEDALRVVEENLDVLTIHGNGAAPAVLAEAGAARAGLLIAVAETDELNIVASLSAKRLGVPTCAARVRNPEYFDGGGMENVPSHYGVDVVIHPERTAAVEIARIVKTPHATQVDYFAGGRVSVVGLHVEAGTPVTSAPLKVLRPQRCVVAAVARGDRVFIPDGETTVLPGDRVYVVIHTGDFSVIRGLTGSEARPLRKLSVVGGGRIGRPLVQLLARGLRRNTRLTLIDKDRRRCNALAALLPDHVLVVEGDGTKLDVLDDGLVAGSDVFVAATSDDATNLLAIMAAKQLGVTEAVTVVSRQDYVPLAQRAGADATVVPRLITAGTLLQLVRKHPVVSLALLEDGRAEAVELIVERGAPAAGHSLEQLQGLDGVLVGAIVRGNDVTVPDGTTRIDAGDRLVLFGLAEKLPRAQGLFRA